MCCAVLLFSLKRLVINGRCNFTCCLAGNCHCLYAGLPLTFGAFGAGLFCALSVGYLKENSRIKEDTVMGIVFSGMFAFGIVLFTKVETEQHLTHILYGNLLGVSRAELVQTFIIATIIFVIMMLKRRDFLLYCFDQSHTRVAGFHLGYYTMACWSYLP